MSSNKVSKFVYLQSYQFSYSWPQRTVYNIAVVVIRYSFLFYPLGHLRNTVYPYTKNINITKLIDLNNICFIIVLNKKRL